MKLQDPTWAKKSPEALSDTAFGNMADGFGEREAATAVSPRARRRRVPGRRPGRGTSGRVDVRGNLVVERLTP